MLSCSVYCLAATVPSLVSYTAFRGVRPNCPAYQTDKESICETEGAARCPLHALHDRETSAYPEKRRTGAGPTVDHYERREPSLQGLTTPGVWSQSSVVVL